MEDLVQKLTSGSHKLRAERTKSVAELKEAIDRGFVLLKFTDTQGGTELGLNIDRARSVLSDADFVAGKGSIELVGGLVLNYNRIEIQARIDLENLEGLGSVRLIQDEAGFRASQQAGKASQATH